MASGEEGDRLAVEAGELRDDSEKRPRREVERDDVVLPNRTSRPEEGSYSRTVALAPREP